MIYNMTFFYNQKKVRCKSRYPLKPVSSHSDVKEVHDENCPVYPKHEEVLDLPVIKSEFVQEKNLKRIYKLWKKRSQIIFSELHDIINDSSFHYLKSKFNINLSFKDLKSEVLKYELDSAKDKKFLERLKNDNPQTSHNNGLYAKDLKVNREKSAGPATNQTILDARSNFYNLQFLLSSQKSLNFIIDENKQFILSTVEWSLNRLQLSVKHINESFKKEQKCGYTTKPDVKTYGDVDQSSVVKYDENGDDFLGFSKQVIQRINSLLDIDHLKSSAVKESISNDGTRSVLYPDGKLAVLYFSTQHFTSLLAFDNDSSNTCIAMFNNGSNGLIFWNGNYLPRIILDKNQCRMFSSNSELWREMNWPVSNNNKLLYSVNININVFVSFHCDGKDSIILRFNSQEAKNNITDFHIHKWFFENSDSGTLKPIIFIGTGLISKFAGEIMKSSSVKQTKKDDATSDLVEFMNSEIVMKRNDIKNCVQKWISCLNEVTRSFQDCLHRVKPKSACTYNENQRKLYFKYEKEFDNPINRTMMGGTFRLRSNKRIDRPQTNWERLRDHNILCPLKLHNDLLNPPSSVDKILEPLLSETCLCSKHDIPKLTDVEIFQFLKAAKPAQLIIVGIVASSTENNGSYKTKMIETSLETMLKDLYVADMKKSIHKPCVNYSSNPYRIFLYDTSISGKFLNSTHSLLFKYHKILPGMCLMFQESNLIFADYIFNGYNSTKEDLFKQIVLSKQLYRKGFYIPRNFKFNFSPESRNWLEETAYSKIQSYDLAKEGII